MNTLQIEKAVCQLIENIGWQNYFSIRTPVYIELVREFYATFEFNKPANFTPASPKVVQFRLMGKEFKFSITELNIDFGFITEEYAHTEEYLDSSCDFNENFDPHKLYRECSNSTETYDSGHTKDFFLRDPVWKYIHRFLAFTFSGRKDSSGVLTKVEFYFLWCMQNKIKVNLGCWLASQFVGVASGKRPLILGSLITHLAVNANLIDLDQNNLHIACEMQPLDLRCLEGMCLVKQIAGVYTFCSPGAITHPHKQTQDNELEDTSERIANYVSTTERRLTWIEKCLTILFEHQGLSFPPSPE